MSLWTIYIRTSENELGLTRTIKAPDLTEAKKNCLDEIKRCLKGQAKQLYLESQGGGKYLIISDMDEIGKVEIQRIRKIKVGSINEKSLYKSKNYFDTRLRSP